MQIRTIFTRRATSIRPATLVHLASAVLLALIVAACGPSAEVPIPTRAPAPTFTPTTEVVTAPVDPVLAATAQAIATAAAGQNQPAANPAQPTPLPEQPTDVPQVADTPADTPTPEQAAQVVTTTNMNVRSGPSTNHAIIGSANQGQTFTVKGKNNAGDWWQIDYNGQDGWVFGSLVQAQNTQAVAIAVNIPTAPPPPPTPIPQPTAVPQPQPAAPQPEPQQPAPEQPAPAPSQNYEFNRALLQKCDPNAGVTYVEGTTYRGGQPVSGYNVVFSYAPDGPVVAKMLSGPHEGYPGWKTGFYSHIIGFDGPREGDWYFWIVDGSDKRISAIAHVHTHGSTGDDKCQQAVIDFDS
jgi:uncharacterized protein YraI